MKNLHDSLRTTVQHVHRLEAKVKALIDAESVALHAEDQADLTSIIESVKPLVEEQYPMTSPQRIFWEQQAEYNKLKSKQQMRWHPLVLRFALYLKYMSTSAYKAVRQSGIIHLPSEHTLHDYTHWSSPHAGVQLEYIQRYSSMLQDACGQRHTALLMDEMKLKSGLVFNKHTGSLVGFVDLGSVNKDIDAIFQGNPQESTSGKLADQVLVFMVRAVFKPSLTMPVAHFFSSNLKGEKIFPLVWDVVEAVELFNIPITSLTSDGAKPNRRFYRMCCKSKKELPYKTHNPYRANESLYFICDVPHLLKTARNCFSNSHAHSNSRTLERNGQAISWKWIEHLYLKETTTNTPGVRIAHKLTRDHVWLNSFTRMRVYLAAQVMSESVASALQILNEEGTRETRLFIRMIDRFFDCLNVKGPILWELKRKDSIALYKSKSDERFKWLKEDFIQYLDEWKREAAALPLSRKKKQKCCLSRETQEGMKITVASFTELGPSLLQLPNVKYLLSEVFSQDPLERYFSQQRHRGGSNENPTAFQVPYNASTLVQQQSMYQDIKTMNVDPEYIGVEAVSTPLPKHQRKTNQL